MGAADPARRGRARGVAVRGAGGDGHDAGAVRFIRHRGLRSERLIRHELVHVRQWRDLGVTGFGRRYLAAYLGFRARGYPHWAAYRRVPLEVAAEWEARTGRR